MPRPATIGPRPISSRGPMRSDSAPKRRESTHIISVIGISASPAATAL